MSDEPKLPPLWKMARNASKAAFKATLTGVTGGDVRVDETEFDDRLAICREPCSLYLVKDEEERCAHEKCGCYLAWKAGLATELCPLNKWPGDAVKIMLYGGVSDE